MIRTTPKGLWLRDVRSSVSAPHHYFGSDIEAELFPAQPDGITYFQHSFNDPWPAQYLGTMDLVHLRGSLAGAAPNPPAATIRNLATLVRPGGWIQLQEINAFRPPEEGNGPAMRDFGEMMRGVWSGIGVGDFANELRDMLGAAGLQNLREKRVVVELGARAGPEVRAASVHGVTSPIKPLSSIARTVPSTFSLEQIDAMQGRVRDELERQGGRIEIVIACGQRV